MRQHPFFGSRERGIRFPYGSALWMKARTNRHRVIIFVLVIPGSLEHLAKGENRRRGLMLGLVDPSGEGIDQLLAVTQMDKAGKGEGLFPKQVNHVLKVIGPLFAKEHVLREWIGQVASFALEICQHMRHGKLRFPQGGRDAKGKNRIDKTMRVADADITFSAKAADLIGVVRNYVNFLDQLYVGDSASESRTDSWKSGAEELFGSLP